MPGDFDIRRKEIWTGALMAGAGAICVLAAFIGHVRFGVILAKIGASLLVYGCVKLSRVLKAPAAGRIEANDALNTPPPRVQLFPLLISRGVPTQALLMSPWMRFCLSMGRIGMVTLLLCFLSLVVTIVLFCVQRTVVLTGVPTMVSGYAVIAAVIFSLLVGISWSTLSGGANPAAIVLRGALFGLLVSFPMLLVPLFITGGQLAQAATFAGNTVVSPHLYRIESAEARSGKGGMHYDATVDPYHCVSCSTPSLPIDERAFQRINASKIALPFGADFPGWPGRQSTSLCVREDVEQAGMAERILLRGPLTAFDMTPCPPGTPS